MFQDLSFSSRWPTKNYFICKLYTYLVEMVSSFSSLSRRCEGGLSDTNLQEVDIELLRPK